MKIQTPTSPTLSDTVCYKLARASFFIITPPYPHSPSRPSASGSTAEEKRSKRRLHKRASARAITHTRAHTPPRLLPLGGVKEDGRVRVSGIDSRAGNRCETEGKSGYQSEAGKLYILCISFFFFPFLLDISVASRGAWQARTVGTPFRKDGRSLPVSGSRELFSFFK